MSEKFSVSPSQGGAGHVKQAKKKKKFGSLGKPLLRRSIPRKKGGRVFEAVEIGRTVAGEEVEVEVEVEPEPLERIQEWLSEGQRIGAKSFAKARAKFEEGVGIGKETLDLAKRYLKDKSREVQQLLGLQRQMQSEPTEDGEEEEFFPVWFQQKKYILGHEPIGLGGFSTVWPAIRYRRFHSLVLSEDLYDLAIKICELDQKALDAARQEAMDEMGDAVSLSEGGEMQVSDIKELETEVRILTDLAKQRNHQHIVELLDYFQLEKTKQVFLVMQRYPINLEDPARAKVFELQQLKVAKVVVIRQLVDALLFLRDNNVIHADLKHSNIMISRMGILRLGDFGLAWQLKSGENSKTVDKVKGSPEYMAPEMLEAGLDFTFSADVWSLGIVIFALYNDGKTMFDQFHRPEMCTFGEDYWSVYRKSDSAYYNSLLGTRYLTEKERYAMVEGAGKKPTPMLERAYKRGRAKIKEVSKIVRGALVPLERDARRHGVDRKLKLTRMSLDEISQLTDALLVKHKIPSETHESQQRGLIVQVLKRFERVQS